MSSANPASPANSASSKSVEHYDLIIVGGGPIGLSTAFHASQRNLKTLIIEQFGFSNNLGSSAGHSRQFRLQYEQQYMSELCLASQAYWDQIQALTSDTLIEQVGSLWFGQGITGTQEGGIPGAENTMDALGIPYQKLPDATAIENQFQFSNLPSDYYGFYQPDGGSINLKATERVLFNAALNSELVTFKEWESVINIDSSQEDAVNITTQRTGEDSATQATYIGTKLVLTPGAYINDTIQSLGVSVPIIIWQMASAYFRKTDPNAQFPTWFVFQEPEEPSDPQTARNTLLYGFPEVDWASPGFIRVATDFPDFNILTDPKQRHIAPSTHSLDIASSWVEQFMPGLDPTPHHTSTCLIALCNAPLEADQVQPEFFLDFMSESVANSKNIITYTAGWAGKFIPILGDMICQMVEDDNLTEFQYDGFSIPLSNFAITWENL